MSDFSWDLRARLKAGIGTYGVPGASIAVFRDEALHEAAAGILNAETGVEATTDSLFHIASVTKPITATIAMQLVDEGKLELDAPVRRYLPDFRVASAAASERVTVRELLCHASGIDGDFFHDTTRGEDRIAKVLEAGCALPQLHDPGRGFSYCNHGFTVLGRIFEVIEAIDFDTIWRRRVSEKLGTPSLLTLTREALRYRVAVGHVPTKGGLRVPKRLFLSPSQGPAGGTPMARARDLVSFALMHLNGGVTREGARVLSEGAVRAMREPNNALPPRQLATHFGLGWMLFDWGGQVLFGHDGLSIFQRSYLRIYPEKRVVLALLTNGGDGGGLFRALATEAFGEAGVTMTPPVAPDAGVGFDPARFVGTYARRSTVNTVAESGGQLTLSSTWTDEWARELYGTQGPFPLEPAGGDIFVWRVAGAAEAPVVHFLNADASGRFRTLHAGLRMNHRQ
jgi:CubicO group peptidase (beta-lactamase class C family)